MFSFLGLIALVQTAPAAPSPDQGSANARPIFSLEDYPIVALKNNWQGDVTVKVRVGKDGRVHRCEIVKSSGHDVLDQGTCDLLITRARFAPATNSSGQPVESDYGPKTDRWRIAGSPPPK